MARGFVYLVAVIDWFTRRVLSHRVSITMEAGFCALEEAIGKYGKPEVFNSDQGSQFTSESDPSCRVPPSCAEGRVSRRSP
jgi:putative transposase